MGGNTALTLFFFDVAEKSHLSLNLCFVHCKKSNGDSANTSCFSRG